MRHLVLQWEETVEQFVYLACDASEILFRVLEVQSIHIDGEHSSLVLILDEVLVEVVHSLQILQLDGLLTVPPALLYVAHQVGDAGFQVNHQVK